MKSQIPNPKSQIKFKFQFSKCVWKFGYWILEFVWKLKIKNCKLSGQGGQLLVEAILAIALLGVLAGIVGMAVTSSTQSNKASGKKTVAASLAQEAVEAVRAIRDNNESTGRGWNNIYEKTEGSDYKTVKPSGNKWELQSGIETINVDGVDYGRKVVFDMDIPRDLPNGGGNINASGSPDKSTIKATITVTASGISGIILEEYLTRAKNDVKVWDTQGDFTGGTCSSTKVTGTGEVELGSGGC